MYEEKEQMNQSSEVVALRRGVNEFFARFAMLGDPYDWRMRLISKSTAHRIDNLEAMKKAKLSSRVIEQSRLNTESFVKRSVFENIKTHKIVKANLQERFAVYRGEQTQIRQVDEERIERETELEINNLWRKTVLDTLVIN